jgi:uncharacterized MAPEG superfamily protein
MTVPLWCLVACVVWTVALVGALSIARLRHLAAGGSVRDFGVPDDRRLLWRLHRAHLNSVENLPLFGSIVLLAAVRGVAGHTFNGLSVLYLLTRVGLSVVHVVTRTESGETQRAAFFIAQIACLLGLAALAVRPT